MIAQGFSKVAIKAHHRYPRHDIELKGVDKEFSDIAIASGARSIEVCQVLDQGEQTFRVEIFELIRHVSYSFLSGWMMELHPPEPVLLFPPSPAPPLVEKEQHEQEQDQESEEDERDWKKPRCDDICRKLQWPDERYDQEALPRYADNRSLKILDQKYRLGDTCFLASHGHPSRLVFEADDGSDSYYSCLAIIAHF